MTEQSKEFGRIVYDCLIELLDKYLSIPTSREKQSFITRLRAGMYELGNIELADLMIEYMENSTEQDLQGLQEYESELVKTYY